VPAREPAASEVLPGVRGAPGSSLPKLWDAPSTSGQVLPGVRTSGHWTWADCQSATLHLATGLHAKAEPRQVIAQTDTLIGYRDPQANRFVIVTYATPLPVTVVSPR
jgi:hypothetical protein